MRWIATLVAVVVLASVLAISAGWLKALRPGGSASATTRPAEPVSESASCCSDRASRLDRSGVAVVGMEMFAPGPDGQSAVFPHAAGTVVHLRLNRPDLHVLALDLPGSRLESITDDRGSRPIAGPVSDGRSCYRPAGEPSADGHQLALQVFAGRVPAAGASHLRIRGQLALVHGVGEKTVEVPLKLARYATAHLDKTVTLRLVNITEPAGPGRQTVLKCQVDPSPAMIKRLAFIDASGQEIRSKGLTRRLDTEFAWQDFALDGRPESVTLRAVLFDRIETARVPLDVTTGVGFPSVD